MWSKTMVIVVLTFMIIFFVFKNPNKKSVINTNSTTEEKAKVINNIEETLQLKFIKTDDGKSLKKKGEKK